MGLFSSIVDFLFGEDKEAVTQKTERLTPEQSALLKKLNDILNEQIGQGVEPYPGKMAAGPSALESKLFSMLENMQPELAATITGFGRDMLTQDQEYDQGAAREYWQQSFVEPTRRAFWEETMPEIREKFAGQGALSSGGFNRAVADAAADMETQLGAILGNILYSGREDFLNRQLQERRLGLQTLDQALREISTMAGVGQIQRGIEQAGLEEQFQKWQTSRPYQNPWLQYLTYGLGTPAYQIDTYTTGGGGGLLGGLMPGIGYGIGGKIGGGLGSMFPSSINPIASLPLYF